MWIESYEHQLHPGLLWKGRDLSAQHVTRYPQIHWSLLAFSCLSWYVVKHTNCIYLVRIVSPLYIGYHKPSNNLVLCSVVVYIYNYIYNVIYLWPRTLSLWQCRKNSDERLDLGILKCTVFRQIHHIPTKYIPIISLLCLHVGQNPCLLEYGIYFDYTHHGFCFVGQNPCLMDLFRTNVTTPSSEMSFLMVRHTKWT